MDKYIEKNHKYRLELDNPHSKIHRLERKINIFINNKHKNICHNIINDGH